MAGGLLALALALPLVECAAGASTVPLFELPRWPAGARVHLEEFAGQIVVLDFFAYWCAPCERASQELETGVQQYYAERQGNARGAPVRVVSVNLEKELPEQTAAWVRRTGASLVVNDFDGTLLKQLGGAGIPFLVIVDGTASLPDAPHFTVAYRHAGFEGVRKLRAVIDGLGGGARRETPPTPPGGGAPPENTFEADAELAWASDMFLTDSGVKFSQRIGGTEWDAAVRYASFIEDYRPNLEVDGLGYPQTLYENRYSVLANLRQRVATPLQVLASASYYDGYPDYRRVWIANRYRQKYADPRFPPIAGYQDPNPLGFGGSAGLRYEYWPALAFAELRLGYQFEQTAPGYEDSTNSLGNYKLIRGRERLDTGSVAFSSENVLARRVRLRNEFSFAQTTDRELRFAYQGSINVALGERWVARGSGGVSTEAPQFNALFFGLTLEYELSPSLTLLMTGRYYSDTGEVENSLPVTSAPPPLTSWEAGAGLRWAVGRSTFRFSAGPFWTDYHRNPRIGKEFIHLYADRNWGLAQLTWSVQF